MKKTVLPLLFLLLVTFKNWFISLLFNVPTFRKGVNKVVRKVAFVARSHTNLYWYVLILLLIQGVTILVVEANLNLQAIAFATWKQRILQGF